MLAPISRPVFSSCRWRSPAAPSGAVPATSMYCPPTIPCTPVAAASSRAAASRLAGSPCLLGQQQPERLGVEAVAGQDRHVLAERP